MTATAEEELFIISDLHLGGRSGFQMCSSATRQRLAQFIRWVTLQHHPERPAHLLLAGDIVDFLAEEPACSFNADEDTALGALKRVFQSAHDFWEALRLHVAAHAPLTLLLGNHDLELCLPRVRHALLERLGHGCVEFIVDNTAFTRARSVLVEHGNRYDPWNAVSHDALRRLRSALSRGEPPPKFAPPPGSELVARVMNEIKARYAFVDLLKPEREGAIPLLALLQPSVAKKLIRVLNLCARAARARFSEEGTPLDKDLISSFSSPELDEAHSALQAVLGFDPDEIGSTEGEPALDEAWQRACGDDKERTRLIERALRALRFFARQQQELFHIGIGCEDDPWLRAARSSARQGFRHIVYGHTHIARRVCLEGGARYYNTGTWADLLRLPAAVFGDDSPQALEEFKSFVADMATNHLTSWRESHPTFCRLALSAKGTSGELYYFEAPGRVRALPDGFLEDRRHG